MKAVRKYQPLMLSVVERSFKNSTQNTLKVVELRNAH